MPRPRRKPERKPKRRLLILCEGARTEPAYFNEIIGECKFRGPLVEVKVVPTEYTSARELVRQAKGLRELPEDEVWVVFDKDGYTKHPEAFQQARANKINIAFSSISFEFWILLHFVYTTAPFAKADDVIALLRKQKELAEGYAKNSRNLYGRTRDRLKQAAERAARVRQHHESSAASAHVFDHNPTTNVDELIRAIDTLYQELEKRASPIPL